MDKNLNEMAQKLVSRYRTRCNEDAKFLEDTIKAGEAVSLFPVLFESANHPSLSQKEKLFHCVRLFFFMGYCMHYNSGIPMLEVLSEWIDNFDEKRKLSNTIESLPNLFDVFINEGVDIKMLVDYLDKRKMMEYVMDEDKKSTRVLKKVLKRKQSSLKNTDSQPLPPKTYKPILSVPEWCIIFYYIDEVGTKEGKRVDRMERFIKDNNIVNPSGTLTTKDSFKNKYHEIENRINGRNNKKPLPPDKIEKILPYLNNNKKAMQKAVGDISYLNDEIEENKRNTY